MMPNVFQSTAFELVTLTDAINKVPHVPMRIEQMGIFSSSGVATTTIAVEERSGSLSLIPNTQRGAPANQNQHNKRKVRDFRIPHHPLEDTILAEEIQDVRAFGATGSLEAVETKRDERLAEMKQKHAATIEYGRIGALKGVILDADGTTEIYDLFDEFGLTQETVDFALATGTTQVLLKCMEVKRLIESALGGMVYQGIHVLAGSEWWDKFITHESVRDAYKYFQANGQSQMPLRDDLRFAGFPFGGITFEEYRGSVGDVDFIAADEAHAFPVGVPGLFRTVFAPGTFLETVNTLGLPFYAKAVPNQMNTALMLHTQSNPLSYCTMPGTLILLETN